MNKTAEEFMEAGDKLITEHVANFRSLLERFNASHTDLMHEIDQSTLPDHVKIIVASGINNLHQHRQSLMHQAMADEQHKAAAAMASKEHSRGLN